MAFDQDELPSWATRARCLFGPETGASPEEREAEDGGRLRVPCFADIGWATVKETLHKCCQAVDIRILSWFHVSSSPTKLTRATLSAWSAPCGGSPIGLALLGTI